MSATKILSHVTDVFPNNIVMIFRKKSFDPTHKYVLNLIFDPSEKTEHQFIRNWPGASPFT